MAKNLRVWWFKPSKKLFGGEAGPEVNGLVVGSFGEYCGCFIVRTEDGKMTDILVEDILRSEWE